MPDNKIGELKKKNMRDAWKNEARDFTPWLQDNISALGDALDMNLIAKEREATVGAFSLDLLAEDGDGRTVAIENQYRSTNHSHLGQLLTYAAGRSADVLIWVTEEVRNEHRDAVEWLNCKTDNETEFYLVKVEVWQIDDSRPAYQFIPVVAPNRQQKEEAAASVAAYGPYFRQFIDELTKKGFPFELKRQHRDSTHYRHFPTGVRGWLYVHEFYKNRARVFLRFVDEKPATAKNLHSELLAHREAIEKNWEGALNWSQGSKTIGVNRPGNISNSAESLEEIRKWAVGQMFKLVEAIPPAMLQEIADKLDAE